MGVLPTLPATPYGALRALKKLQREAAHEIERLTVIVDVIDDDQYMEANDAAEISARLPTKP
jgi:hypothetical protein